MNNKENVKINGNFLCNTFAFVIFLVGLFFTVQAYAYTPRFEVNAELTSQQRYFYLEKCEWHELQAEKAFRNAEDLVWYMPQSTNKEKAQSCFATAIACVSASTPQSKIVATISTLLLNYGLYCMDEYDRIQEFLYKARYHREMEEFFEAVLILG